MKHSATSKLRVTIALVAVCILVTQIDSAFATLDMIGTFDPELIRYLAASVTAFFAFLVGGLIAKQRFALIAAVFAVILRILSLRYFADWADTTFMEQLSRSWTYSLIFLIFSVLGAVAGVSVRTGIENLRSKAAT